nr:hypothetical protein [Mycetohabitans sp. B8]
MVDFMLEEKRMVWFNDQWSYEPILSIFGGRHRIYPVIHLRVATTGMGSVSVRKWTQLRRPMRDELSALT